MKLFVNGCSHTEGTKLSTPKHLTWPSLFKQQGYEVCDESRAGCSNARIKRSTMEHVLKHEMLDLDLAIIQFTDATRLEVPKGGSGLSPYCNPHPEYEQIIPKVHNVFGQGYENLAHNKFHTPFCQEHFRFPKQRALMDFTILTDIISLQSFFRDLNIDYVFMVWWPWHDKNFWQNPGAMRMWQAIDTSRIINADEKSLWHMDKVVKDRGFKMSMKKHEDGLPDYHFMPDAHQWMAEAVENFMNNGEKVKFLNTDNGFDSEAIYRYG